ncbi:RluA family pseudouridine synthase [Candidatus Peribacteria bacterium]|nr:RluA family pseudouridine synthase [Candidatus Peribacteria bacterium]
MYEALRTKKITISGRKLPESTKLRSGDVLDIDIPSPTLKIWQTRASSTRVIYEKLDPTRILYEDTDILVYDKPSGLIVHSPDHKTDEVSLIEQIEDYLISKGWKPSGTFQHPALAHRIDRDTSGIIISCLNRQSYEHMAEQFRTRKVEKTYHALVMGVPEPRQGLIIAPLLRLDTGRTDEAKVIVDTDGQTAETTYKVIKTGTKNDWSLVELHPKTGRTHQIRVHMAHIGHPLIGDKRYGGPIVVKFPELRDLHGRKGHLLHAEKISFTSPNSNRKKVFQISSQSFF